MPLVGGGGAPNVAGSNPSGTGTNLNYIGEHAYALSGAIAATTTLETALQFTTGTSYMVGTLNFNGYADDDDPANRNAGNCLVSFDSQIVMLLNTGSSAQDMPTEVATKILIPPYTNVLIQVESSADSADQYATVSIVGRVYA
tara:strand:- start:225 stop:653 length:429 start_codon:yes stop_codon:yes gene_type:complete